MFFVCRYKNLCLCLWGENKAMRKIIIELQIDWDGYEDVADEIIVDDAIEAKLSGVGWRILDNLALPQAKVIKSGCVVHGNVELDIFGKCPKCNEMLYVKNEQPVL